jgi:hypothetical protein
MRTWIIIVFSTVLGAGSIVAIAHHSSNGFEHRRALADQITNSRQPIQQISTIARPLALVDKADTNKVPDAEPWGPFRSVDW